MRFHKCILLLTALGGCTAAFDTTSDTTTGSSQDLRAISPNEVVGPAPSAPTDYVYDGTTVYRALSFHVAALSDVHASLAARSAGRQVLGWITRNDGVTLLAAGPGSPLTLDMRLDTGDYLLVFRDANQLPGTIAANVEIVAAAAPPPPPPPPPPPGVPSFLLPPGKNGASATAEFSCSSTVEYLIASATPTSPTRYGKSTINTQTTCSGYLEEHNSGGPRDLRFIKSACTQTKAFDNTVMSDIEGKEEVLGLWTYSLSKDAYVFERGPTVSATLAISPTVATGSVVVPHSIVPLMTVVEPKVPMRPDSTRLESCRVRFTY